MNKNFILLLSAFLIFLHSNMFSQSWEWLKNMQSSQKINANDMISFNDTMLCLTGTCDTAFVFNGNVIANNPHYGKYAWIMVINSNGQVYWNTTLYSNNEVFIQRVIFNNNKLYFVGTYRDSVITGDDTLIKPSAESLSNAYIAVFDINGNYIESKNLFSAEMLSVNDIAVSANIYISGVAEGKIILQGNYFTLYSYNPYVFKSDTNLNYIWLKTTTKCSDIKSRCLIDISETGDTLFGAINYADTINLGTYNFYSNGYSIATFSSDTSLLTFYWAKNINSVNSTLTDFILNNEKLYLTGYVKDTADFGNGYYINPNNKSFLAIYSYENGNILNILSGQSNKNYAAGITTDKSSNVYLTLHTDTNYIIFNYDTIALSAPPGNIKLIVYKISDDSVMRYHRSLYSSSEMFNEFSFVRVVTDLYGNVYVVANISSTVTSDSLFLNVSGINNAFLGKISCIPLSPFISTEDIYFCPTDSLLLNVNTSVYNNVIWNTGDTSNYIYVHNPGIYNAYLSDENHCLSPVSNIEIFHHELPVINIERNCDTLFFVPPINSTYLWLLQNDTLYSNVNSIITHNQGYYMLALIDSNGCYITDSMYHYPKILPMLQVMCDTITAFNIAAQPYFWLYENDTLVQNQTSVMMSESGYYTLALTDSNGCYITDSMYHYPKILPTIQRICDTLLINNISNLFIHGWIYQSDTIISNGITANENGLYEYYYIDSNYCNINAKYEFISTNKEIIFTKTCDSLYIINNIENVDWYLNNHYINNANHLSVSNLDKTGSIYAIKIDTTGCVLISNSLDIGFTEINHKINLYPNPITGSKLTVEYNGNDIIRIEIINENGSKFKVHVISDETILSMGNESCSYILNRLVLDVGMLYQGIFMVRIMTKDLSWQRTFVKL